MEGLLKNTWLDEIHVRTAADDISKSLICFVGTKADIDQWGKHTLDRMRSVKIRIRDSLMWKYTFKYQLDEQEHVQSLEFVKLPWLI